MGRKRYVVELGTGVDLHGNDVTKAACRAVRDAISRSCLCGIMEILDLQLFQTVHVEVLVASPFPDNVDPMAVMEMIPIGTKSIRSVMGGMIAQGICVDHFGHDCDSILMANAAVTVFVDVDEGVGHPRGKTQQ